ncbi:hypothetical protein VTK73DRAFT_6371 [Phialemonium thermophilum]|uniref:Uncharacterized protein n=1 Tax=Phialemonium thermophilum TaxID=223376 RepID=A0ABR3XVE5_9PEZI
MYGSYGSYSCMSTAIDISPDLAARSPDSNCAFPSWPRRSSLSESDQEQQKATSFLSDEDLWPSSPLECDTRSVSSSGSGLSSHSQSPTQPLTDGELLEMQHERAAYQREIIRLVLSEKERRRQAMKKQRRPSGSSGSSSCVLSKKNAKTRLSAMTPIAEKE